MLCQKCGKNPATTHIQTVVNGVANEINLCESCAAKTNYSPFTKNSLVNMLASVFGETQISNKDTSTLRCECCNSSFYEIAQSGRTGCAQCYKTFRTELLPYIKRVHGTTKHIGKKPNSSVMVIDNSDEIFKLREKLSELIKKEKFEEAAIVRDEIKRVQEES